MSPIPPSVRGPACPPAAVLEALSAGEPVAPGVEAHAAGCDACTAQLQALRAEAEAFRRARPADRFLRQLERREASAAAAPPRRPLLRRLVPALGLAIPLALAVVIAPRLLGGPETSPGVTFKGDGFRVAVARGGQGAPELAASDAVVRAGDALRFSYEAPQDGFLLVLELDGRGAAAVLHPWGAAAAAPQKASQREFLPGSVVLDDAPGPEFLFAVFSAKPFEAAPLLEALRAQARRPEPALACDGCTVSTLRLRKAP
ncbi:MAG: hypothetical protein U0229_21020 [Anaeromyxobacter sp.]